MPAYRKHEKTAQIVEMRKTMPMKEIAKALGISLSTVNYHCMIHRGSLGKGKNLDSPGMQEYKENAPD